MSEPEDPWRDAFARLIRDEDVKPLASLLRNGWVVPPWLAHELAELLEPLRPLLVGNDPESKRARLDLKNADRLVFVRTKTTRRKIATQERKVSAGQMMLDAMASGERESAVKKIAGKGGDPS
jgi:hypothetical protein